MTDFASIGIDFDARALKKGEEALRQVEAQALRSAGATVRQEQAFKDVSVAAGRASTAIGAVAGAIGVASLFQASRALIQLTDNYTKFTAQLKLATDSQNEFAQAYSNVLGIARSSQSDISSLGVLYARITNATKQLGVSQAEVGKITETVALSLRVSGATAAESASAMLQLSQAFGSGVLRGEEFNAVNEAAPRLMKALADSLGQPIGALREMATQGELTADVLARAFKDDALIANLRDQSKEVLTVSSAVVALKNELSIFVGELDKTTGASKGLAEAIGGIAEFIGNNQDGITTFLGTLSSGAVIGGIGLAAANIGKVTLAVEGLALAAAGAAKNPLVLALFGLTALASAAAYAEQQVADIEKTLTDQTKIAELSKKIAESEAFIAETRKPGGNRLAGIEEQKTLNRLQEEYNALVMANAGLDRDYKAEWLGTTTKQSELQKTFSDAAYEAIMAEFEAKEKLQKLNDSNNEKNAQAINAIVMGLREQNAILEATISKGEELTQVEKARIQFAIQYGAILPKRVNDLLKENEALDKAAQSQRDYNAAVKKARDDAAQIVSQAAERVDSIREQIMATEDEAARIVLTTQALRELEIAKTNDSIASKQQRIDAISYGDANDELIAQYRLEIQELERLKNAKAGLFEAQDVQKAKQQAKQIADEQAKAFEQVSGDITRSITDAIASGSLKGRDLLKRIFETTVIRLGIEPFIKGGVGAVFSALGLGTANAGDALSGALGGGIDGSSGGGLSSLVSGVKSVSDLASIVTKGFTGIETSIYNGFARSLNTIGITGETNILLSNIGTTLAGIAGGIGAGRAISGGYAIGGGSGNSAVNIGTAIGAFFGPLGALAGGALGGVANRLFGRKRVLGAGGIQGDFDIDGLSNAQTFQDVTLKGGFFRSSKSFTEFGGVDPKLLQAINAAFADVVDAAKSASMALGADFADAFENFALSGRLGSSAEAVVKGASDKLVGDIISSTLGGMAEEFKAFLNSIKQDQEQLIDAYARAARSVTVANRALFALGQAAQFSIRNAETAFDLLTVLGDNGVALLDQFVQRFVPASEQATIAAKNFEVSLKNLGLQTQISANTTREEFKNLVQGLDLTTEAGQRQLQSLLGILPELDAIISKREQEEAALKALKASIEANVSRIRGDFQGLLDAIATRAASLSPASFSAAIGSIQAAANSVSALPFVQFTDTLSSLRPSEQAYRDFIVKVGTIQPDVGSYLTFIKSVDGLAPSTRAFDAFVQAINGTVPVDDAYRTFIASVSNLRPSDALYRAFVQSVSSVAPSAESFNLFVAQIQARANSLRTQGINGALDALQDQIDQLQDVVVTVNFGNFTAQINAVSAEIARLGNEISSTTDVGARLQLEGQLQAAIVARYELEQQMLGGVFASIQEVLGSVRGERVAVREAAVQILGGPRVLSPDEIRNRVENASALGQLPTLNTAQVQEQQRLLDVRQGSLDAITAKQQAEILAKQKKIADAELAMIAVRPNYEKELSEVRQAAANAIAVGNQFTFVSGRRSSEQFARFGIKQNDQGVSSRDNAYFVANTSEFNTAFAEFAKAQDLYISKLNLLNTANKITIQTTDQQIQAQRDLVQAQVVELEKARTIAQQEFAESLQMFVIDAGKATSQLGKLREETVRYFQEQQRLAGVLQAASQGLRQTVADIRFSDLSAQDQLQSLLGRFDIAFSQASTFEGDDLAKAGDALNALINPILQTAQSVFGTGQSFQDLKTSILGQAEQIATRIESLTPVDYQQESLALLDTIDTTLALIEENTKSAEALIVEAIGVSADRTVAALSEIYKGITGTEIPAFARGGMFNGGVRLVGEQGPELEFTGPSRIMSAQQTREMFANSGNSKEVVEELQAANRELRALVRVQATANQKIIERLESQEQKLTDMGTTTRLAAAS